MVSDPWLPVGFELPDGATTRTVVYEGKDWQVYATSAGGRALLSTEELGQRWRREGLVSEGWLVLTFGNLHLLQSDARHSLVPLDQAKSPSSLKEAMAFAVALRDTRRLAPSLPIHDAIYVERFSRLLPTWSLSEACSDDIVVGKWLSGGVRVSAKSFRRLSSLLSWLPPPELRAVVEAAGIALSDRDAGVTVRMGAEQPNTGVRPVDNGVVADIEKRPFRLPGRADLEHFFLEHVIDIVQKAEAYRAVGIEFPSPIALHGPPGCGKTFAVERLVEYLGWPSFSIDSSSIGSPYIHETGKKIAKTFDDALKASPSVVIIDEMDAFLSDRQLGGVQGLHHVEEVAEFLRRIPEAIKNHVLIIGMTNRLDMIDPAILRRGRFDHVIEVGMPSAEEVRSLVHALLAVRPCADEVDYDVVVGTLSGRPLSDVSFIIRESARLAVKSGQKVISQRSLTDALGLLPPRDEPGGPTKPIGFKPL